jgi:splicing factor 3A subunit 3
VAEKLKSNAKSKAVTADIIEEFEDDQGNVFNKKTYEGMRIST